MYDKSSVVAEMAGKDSIAAIIKYATENKGSFILPTIVRIPPEEDRYESLFEYYEYLKDHISSLGSHMYTPIILDGEEYWWELNKPILDIMTRYNFYTPCIACHALLHSMRIPIALKYGRKIITGERLSHNGKVKINQNQLVLDIFDDMLSSYGIEIVRPIMNEENTDSIQSIVNDFHKIYGINDPKYIKCHIGGNFPISCESDLSKYKIEEYCNDFLLPMLDKIIKDISVCYSMKNI
jgi:hypothetical protein